MNWSDLSMSQRSELMSIYLKNGISSLDEMKKHYNSFAEGGFTSPSYPPFNNTPQRTDIYDNEKRARGKWHVENAKGNPNSVITKAFNEAKSKGFNDNQAYEYVFDVASSKGWAKEGSVIQERTIPYKATINNIQDNTYVAKRPQIVPIQPKFVDYDKHQEEDLRYKAEEEEKELQAWKDIATTASLAGAAMADKNPILGAMMQIPDIYMDWRYSKYPGAETSFNGLLETMAIADNSIIGDKVENVLFKVPKFGKYLGGGYHLFRGLNDYGIPVGATNDAIDIFTGKSGIEHIGDVLEDSDEVAANMLRTNIAKSSNSFAEGGSIDDPPYKKYYATPQYRFSPERFFGVATPEVTDNTVYQPTYGTLLPEVKVAAFPGATDYDMARYKSGQLSSTTLDSIAKKRRTGQSQFMQDVNKLAWIPNGAMGLAGGLSGALANPYLWGAIGLSSAAQNIEDKNYGEAALDVGLTFLGPELQLINKAAEATRFGKSARIASELNKAIKSTRLQPKSVENPVHNLFYRKSDKPYLQEYIPTIEPSISDLFQIKGGLQRTADRLGTNINHYYNNVISPEEFMKLQHSVLPISEDFIQPRYIPSGFPYGLKESKILMPYDKMRQNPLFAKYKDLPDNEFKEVMDDLVGSHEFIHYHNNRIRKNILNNKYNPNMSEFQKHKLSYDGDKYFQGMSYPEEDYSNSYLLAGNGTEVNARLAQLYNIFNTNYLTPNEFHIAKRFYPSSILDNDMTTFFNRINDEEAFLRTANDNVGLLYNDGGPIHIKPENRGKFTALKKRTGHSASWFKENGTPAQKKMAVFALNVKKWRK